MSIALDASMSYLRTKTWYYSMEHNSQGINTCTYYLMPPNSNEILNHRLIIQLGGCVWLIEEIFLPLDGYTIPLGDKV